MTLSDNRGGDYLQEDLTNRTIALSIRTATFTARTLQNAIRAVLQQIQAEERKEAAAKQQKMQKQAAGPKGKQTLKSLMGSNSTLSNLEVMKENLRPFQKVADKYGIDFAVTKEKGTSPPRYLVFFKGKDVDVITAAFQEFARTKFGIDEKQSIKESLDTITRESKTKKLELERAIAKGKMKIREHAPKVKAKVKVPEVLR